METVERYEAWLVAKGFHQREGQDFELTYSYAAKAFTIRTVLVIAVSRRWSLDHLDVCNAFLNGELTELVHMEKQPGYKDKQFPKHVCQLRKALYELKQAPWTWYHRLKLFLEVCGFQNSQTDSSLFVWNKDTRMIYVLVYVDDFIITGSHPKGP